MRKLKVPFYLDLAQTTAEQSTCLRAQVGAVIVSQDRVISLGYNGSPRGTPHCTEIGCLLRMNGTKESCVRAVHAETNAVINAAYGGASTKDAVMYCTHFPCNGCIKTIINAGIARVHYLHRYPDDLTQTFADYGGVLLYQFIPPVN